MNKNGITEKIAKTLKKTEDYLDANAAVIVLLKASDNELKVLLVKRAEKSNDPWSGQLAFPGGKRGSGDRDLRETMVRETLEETAINASVGCRFLGTMKAVRSTQRPEMKIIPFVVLQEKEQNIELNEELTEYFWIPLKKLVHSKGYTKYRSEDYPAFIIEHNVIWGLTYRILYNLLSLLFSFRGENKREA